MFTLKIRSWQILLNTVNLLELILVGGKKQTDENECEYILFRIDVYFTEYFLAVEIDEKGHTDRDLIFEEKRQKTFEKKLNCEFIRINTSREIYDASYEVSRIQTFISNSNKNKIKKLEDEIKN